MQHKIQPMQHAIQVENGVNRARKMPFVLFLFFAHEIATLISIRSDIKQKSAPQAPHGADFCYSFTSGRPASDVKSDTTPANAAADTTIRQSTSVNNAVEPMVPMAACATVFIARIAAAFTHIIVFPFNFFHLPSFFRAISSVPTVCAISQVQSGIG